MTGTAKKEEKRVERGNSQEAVSKSPLALWLTQRIRMETRNGKKKIALRLRLRVKYVSAMGSGHARGTGKPSLAVWHGTRAHPEVKTRSRDTAHRNKEKVCDQLQQQQTERKKVLKANGKGDKKICTDRTLDWKGKNRPGRRPKHGKGNGGKPLGEGSANGFGFHLVGGCVGIPRRGGLRKILIVITPLVKIRTATNRAVFLARREKFVAVAKTNTLPRPLHREGATFCELPHSLPWCLAVTSRSRAPWDTEAWYFTRDRTRQKATWGSTLRMGQVAQMHYHNGELAKEIGLGAIKAS